HTVHRSHPEFFTFSEHQHPKFRLADSRGVFQYRFKHWVEVASRRADNLQHFRSRGLLVQRFAQVIGALAQLVEQPRVLDGDDGLRSEVSDQFNLLVGEWAHFLTVDDYRADRFIGFKHGNAEHGPCAGEPYKH